MTTKERGAVSDAPPTSRRQAALIASDPTDEQLHHAAAARVVGLRSVVSDATSGADEQPVGEQLPAPSNPMGVARELVDADYRHEDCFTLRQWRGSWMRWERTHWGELEDRAVRAWAYEKLENATYVHVNDKGMPEVRDWRPNRRKVADVLDALAATTHLSEVIDPPGWLGSSPLPPGEVVACKNGLLHVGTRTLADLTPTYFNRVAVPFDYDPEAPKPTKWLEFLDQLWPDDSDAIAALREFFGYVISGRTDLQKILLLIGPTRAGKGVIARVLTQLIGTGNAAGPTLASLGTNFGLSPLLGKPLAVVSDARLGGQNVNQVVERLLSISGEDMLTIDRKYREPWTGKLSTRFLILSNELPRFGDASGAIANRFVVLSLTTSFLGKENPKLTTELLAELPGILTWALDGLDALAEQGTFTEPKSSSDSILALQDLVSPWAAFVRDECLIGAGKEVPVADVYARWRHWCEDNGRDRPGTVQTFGRDLRAVVPGVRVVQPREGATRERRYSGLDLKPLSKTHNGTDRVPPRAGDVERGGTRPTPMWTQPQAGHDVGESERDHLDNWIAAQVTTNPEPVGAIAAALNTDVWEVEHALKRLAERGRVQRHNSRPGSPVAWSLPSSDRAAS